MLTYANMNIKKRDKAMGANSCLRLLLNRLKEMKGCTPIYTFLET
jgi:hypothetical protein